MSSKIKLCFYGIIARSESLVMLAIGQRDTSSSLMHSRQKFNSVLSVSNSNVSSIAHLLSRVKGRSEKRIYLLTASNQTDLGRLEMTLLQNHKPCLHPFSIAFVRAKNRCIRS